MVPKQDLAAPATWTVSPQPFVEYSVGVGVQQDEDGVVGRQVSLPACAVQEQVCQVVEASHHWVIVPLGGAVACNGKMKTHKEMFFLEEACTADRDKGFIFFLNHLRLYF